MVNWPCVLKLEGDNELEYFKSEVEFMRECNSLILSEDDHLIDSVGQCYSLNYSSYKNIMLEPLSRTYSTDEVTLLIQAHEFSKAEMCLTKIQFTSVSEAIASLA
ncbi:DUF4144 family protein [Vibrio sp. MA40-2]|uniref:DUF4144 family protein n=1 Tax=Vibrio sp. MA40-2 TaxID=3391828 RepID=UPI0039A45D17